MSLLSLPNETLQQVACEFSSPRDLASLMQTCKLLEKIGAAVLYNDVEIKSVESSLKFFAIVNEHPVRVNRLRRIHLKNAWLFTKNSGYPTKGVSDSAARIISLVSSQLEDLGTNDLEYACHYDATRGLLANAILQCNNLIKLTLEGVSMDSMYYGAPNWLLDLQAPLQQLTISNYETLGFSILHVLNNFEATLTHLTLSKGDLRSDGDDDTGYRLPHVTWLALHGVDAYFPVMEAAFPNVRTLELRYDDEFDYFNHEEMDHWAHHWTRLPELSTDVDSAVLLGNLCGFTVERLDLTALEQVHHLPHVRILERQSDILELMSPHLLRIKDGLNWTAVVDTFGFAGPRLASLWMLDLSMTGVTMQLIDSRVNLDALTDALSSIPSLKQLRLTLLRKRKNQKSGQRSDLVINNVFVAVITSLPALVLFTLECRDARGWRKAARRMGNGYDSGDESPTPYELADFEEAIQAMDRAWESRRSSW